MAKRILLILNREENVWCNLMNEKCKRWSPWMQCKGKDLIRNGRIIANNMTRLKDGLKVAIGNGIGTNTWNTPWITCLSLSFNDSLDYNQKGGRPVCRSKDISVEMQLNYWESSLFCGAAWKEGESAGVGFVLTEHDKWKVSGADIAIAGSPLKVELSIIWYDLDNVRKNKEEEYD
ncbi:hypothetical protein Cni_G13303 [Canna indica]|uniref:Uncharacterized protein n=1 Tax=Canna indica TaxID=4628 RepID=A0AAQ3K9K5_9LILI|nr:hypothetical protein Cni_G13303 [Canna indica]